MIKPSLISLMYLTLEADFQITLHLMKSNSSVALVGILQKFITKPQSMSMN